MQAVKRAACTDIGLLNIGCKATDDGSVLLTQPIITGKRIGLGFVRGELNENP